MGWILEDAVVIMWYMSGMCGWHWDLEPGLGLTEKVLEGGQ